MCRTGSEHRERRERTEAKEARPRNYVLAHDLYCSAPEDPFFVVLRIVVRVAGLEGVRCRRHGRVLWDVGGGVLCFNTGALAVSRCTGP